MFRLIPLVNDHQAIAASSRVKYDQSKRKKIARNRQKENTEGNETDQWRT